MLGVGGTRAGRGVGEGDRYKEDSQLKAKELLGPVGLGSCRNPQPCHASIQPLSMTKYMLDVMIVG